MDAAKIGQEKYHWVGGMYVEEDALRIAERVSEYDPNLKVQYLEEAASIGDPPFRVIEVCKDGVERTVLYAWELDNRILERIYAADTVKQNIDKKITDANTVARENLNRRYREELEEARNIIKSIIRTDKETYILKDKGRKIKVHQYKPAEVEVE